MREVIATNDGPKAIGPYSQAIKANGLVFLSGQIALDPATQQLISGDVAAQTERVLQNLAGILKAAGSSLPQVVKTTVFLKNMSDFAAMNEVYGRYFTRSAARALHGRGGASAQGCAGGDRRRRARLTDPTQGETLPAQKTTLSTPRGLQLKEAKRLTPWLLCRCAGNWRRPAYACCRSWSWRAPGAD